jgi:NADPH:quinone reductase-like Zn-dependent oxidoreductase
VPGHEVVGKIDALGEGVSAWKLGQRVGVGFLGGYCGRCTPCRRGDFVNCQNQPVSGVADDGGYAEVMIADERALAAVPAELAPADAAPLLCAGVTTYNALRNSPARPGDLVAVQGIGGLGHLAVQFANRMGFRVAAIARGEKMQPLARRLVEAGARVVTLNYSKWDWHGGKNAEGQADNSIFVREAEDFPVFDRCVSALVEDLHQRGLDRDCTVVILGEFGRTPQISAQVGRDRWPQVNCALLAGGGMKAGQVIGATDRIAGRWPGR